MKKLENGDEFIIERNGVRIKFFQVMGVSRKSYHMELPANLNYTCSMEKKETRKTGILIISEDLSGLNSLRNGWIWQP